ncbi:hypothetical protein HWV62_1739 [Athelia sp. TMB]|nr:hypothetical protein HWV62_1739 [Athelia sp. TMB]
MLCIASIFTRFVASIEEAESNDHGIAEVALSNIEPSPDLMALYKAPEALWRRLGVAPASMDTFVEAHRGSMEEGARENEEELERIMERMSLKAICFNRSTRDTKPKETITLFGRAYYKREANYFVFRVLGTNIGQNAAPFAGGKTWLMAEPDLELGDDVGMDDCSVVTHIHSWDNFTPNRLCFSPSCALRSGSRLLSSASMQDSSMLYHGETHVPAAATGFGYSKHWIYWVGPFLGSVLGATIYTLLKYYYYYELTPDQAAIDYRKSPGHPVENVKSIIAHGSVNDGGNVDMNGESDYLGDKPLNERRVNDSPV